jgi:hypothetical protein
VKCLDNKMLYEDGNDESLLPTSYKMLSNILLSRLSPYVDHKIISVGSDPTDQLLTRFFYIRHIPEKNGSTKREYISYS